MKSSLFLLTLISLSASVVAEDFSYQQSPGYYRMMVGNVEVTAVSDGTVVVPLKKLLTNITPEKLTQRMAEASMTPDAETSINAFVVNNGKERILIHTGAGELFGDKGGHLIENLRAAGYPAESIDKVLLTHIHADHSGGVSLKGKPAFPNAKVYVEKKDVDFWLNPAHMKDVEESQRHTFTQSQQTMGPVIKAGLMQAFTAPSRITPEIQALPAAGHTPGSVLYVLESEGQKMVFWGDIIHAEAVQMPEPQVAIHFDVNQIEAVRTRERVLADAAQQDYWIAAAHIAFPGFGHVKKQAKGYRWVAANYSRQLKPALKISPE